MGSNANNNGYLEIPVLPSSTILESELAKIAGSFSAHVCTQIHSNHKELKNEGIIGSYDREVGRGL